MGRFGIVHSFGTSFNITADTVVIAGRESVEIVQSVNGDGVFRSIISKGGGIAADAASCHVVGSLGTD